MSVRTFTILIKFVLLSVFYIFVRRETALVATLDGTLSLVEVESLKILWSIKTGLPIYSSYQASQNLDLNVENASGHGDDTYIDCGDDWILYKHDRTKGIMEVIHENLFSKYASSFFFFTSCKFHNVLFSFSRNILVGPKFIVYC